MNTSVVIDVDFFSDELFAQIKNEVVNREYNSLEKYLYDFKQVCELEYTDSFVEKMKLLCRFLIDEKEYKYVSRMFKCSFVFCTFDSREYESESVIVYAILKMSDDDICDLIKDVDFGQSVAYFYECVEPSVVATNYRKYHTLKMLFEKNLACEKYSYGDMTILQHAAHIGDCELVEFSLNELKHNVNYGGLYDISPLALAVDGNHFNTAELLIEFGADVTARSGDGREVYRYARSQKMLDILFANGVDIEKTPFKKCTKSDM